MKFLIVLRTFASRPIITLSADENGLRIEGVVMNATRFSPTAAVPGEFQIFPVADA
jgi:hypothetical protein